MALCFEDSLLLIDPLIERGVKEESDRGRIWAESAVDLERTLMHDVDHQVIGARIARRWGMDGRLVDVIRRHHRLDMRASSISRLVSLADLAANTVFAYPCRPEQAPLVRLLGRVDAGAAERGGDPDRVAREMLSEELAADRDRILEALGATEPLWEWIDPVEFLLLCRRTGPFVRKMTLDFLRLTSSVK
jgi:hypothetical protein